MIKHGVQETTATVGAGTLTLVAASEYARVSGRFNVGNLMDYLISDINGNKEWGVGTVGAANTLARTTITGTLSAGVYTAGGTALSLSGNCKVVCLEHEASQSRGGGTSCEAFGASPSASAAVNTAAIQSALNLKGLVTLLAPGTYLINPPGATQYILYRDNTRFLRGPGVIIKNADGAGIGNFGRNEHWNSPLFAVTSIITTTSPGGTGTATNDFTIATAMTAAVGSFVLLRGDPTGLYEGIFEVIGGTPGVNLVARIGTAGGNTLHPTLTAGTTKLSVSGFTLNANANTYLTTTLGLVRTALAGNAFLAPITTTDDGIGAIAQVDSRSSLIWQIIVSEPGFGYTDFTSATINVSDGYSGAGNTTVSLAQIATPHVMTICAANANIAIEGGAEDHNAVNTGIFNATDQSQSFIHVMNKVRNPSYKNVELKQAPHIAFFTTNTQNLLIEEIAGNAKTITALGGPCWGATLRNLYNKGNDDAWSSSVCTGVSPTSTTDDYSTLDMPHSNGPVQDVVVETTRMTVAASRGLVSPGRGFVCRGFKIRNIITTPSKPHIGRDIILWSPNSRVTNAGGGYAATAMYFQANPALQGITPGMRFSAQGFIGDTFVVSIKPATGQPAADGWTYVINLTQSVSLSLTGARPLVFEAVSVSGTIGLGDTPQSYGGCNIGGLASFSPNSGVGTGFGLIDDFEIDGASGDGYFGAPTLAVANIAAANATPVTIDSLRVKSIVNHGFKTNSAYIQVGLGQTVRNMSILNSDFSYHTSNQPGSDNNRRAIDIFGTVDDLIIERCTMRVIGGGDVSPVLFATNPGAVVKRVTLNNCPVINLGWITGTAAQVLHSSVFATNYSINNCAIINGSNIIAASESCNVRSSGCSAEGSITGALFNFFGTSKTHNLSLNNIQNLAGAAIMSYGTTNTFNIRGGDGTLSLKSDTAGHTFTFSIGAMVYDTQTAAPGIYVKGPTVYGRVAA